MSTEALQKSLIPALRACLVAYGALVLLALLLVPAFFLPAEDAAILFQYSRNLATHGVVSYLPGGPPVEGATDFAWMLLLALGYLLRIPPFWAVAVLNTVVAGALAAILLRLAKLPRSPINLLAAVGTFGLVPQVFAALSGFATLADAALLAALVLFAIQRQAALASLTGLVLCLFRPDGVLFAVPLLAALVFRNGARRQRASWVALCFVLPGAVYFVWRVHYFHEWLPLPFLVKADTRRTLGLVVPTSVRRSIPYLVVTAVPLTILSWRHQLRHKWLVLPLLIVPTLFYWAMRLDQNVAGRFFFYIPLAAAILAAANWPEAAPRRSAVVGTAMLAWIALLAAPLARELRTFRDLQFPNVRSIAVGLKALQPPGTLLVSEAGLLPFYSDWPTIDAWGLNTPHFSHHFFQPGDVVELHPDLIVLHPDLPDTCVRQSSWPSSYPERSWTNLTRNLVLGADPAQYSLWILPYGSPFYRRRNGFATPGQGDRECWFLRRSAPVYTQVAHLLARNGALSPDKAVPSEQQRLAQK